MTIIHWGELFISGRVHEKHYRKCRLKGELFMMQLLLASATIVLMIVFIAYQIYKIRWLRSQGRQIIAVVTSIRQETGKSAGGISRDNYAVTATWTNPRTGRTYTFWTWVMHSRPVYTQGSLVPVVIDPNNPKRYALDLEEHNPNLPM
jgi:hypothetical protein